MYVIKNDLFDDAGRKLATFSGHWPACAAMLAHGKPLDETKWPIRDLSQDDVGIIRSMHHVED